MGQTRVTVTVPSTAAGVKKPEKETIQRMNDYDCDKEFYDAIEDPEKKIDAPVVSYLLKQKDTIITELRDKIKLLYVQIDLLNKINDSNINKDKDKEPQKEVRARNVESPSTTAAKQVRQENTTVDLQKAGNSKTIEKRSADVVDSQTAGSSKINQKHMTAKLHELNTLQKCTEIINLGDATSPNVDNWQTVKYKQKPPRRKMIVGCNVESTVKGVPKNVILHVSRVENATTAEDLTKLLKPVFPEVKCDLMTSKFPSIYSSFKENNGVWQSALPVAMSRVQADVVRTKLKLNQERNQGLYSLSDYQDDEQSNSGI
ncbi:unnamed protein product [Phaedon cochleariae]|uniref:Uncharacterized protein n=1 Tax=Phaedon cochleariae TaxID=80249 RepID=A0A9N9X1V6_PHACE|nr:unnamed protein product [Phaedon cochleariae]